MEKAREKIKRLSKINKDAINKMKRRNAFIEISRSSGEYGPLC